MAWNEPGGSGNKDPWGNRNNEQGPPDLDEFIKKLQDKLGGLFGGKGGGGSSRGGSSGGGIGLSFIALIAVVVWALSGIYIIEQGKQGVVMQFGAFHSITNPGPHWYPRFIQSVEIVDVEGVRSVNLGHISDEALMLTQDENIIDIKFTVQYKIQDARDYVFNVKDPDVTLRQATESAVREIVGKSKLDTVLTEGRLDVAARTKELIQSILDSYKAGLLVVNLNMQDAQPPQQVQHAFDDAIKAREDEQRQINEAEAYSNDILPKARGKAARVVQEAHAYREEVVARAEGETERFEKVLIEYKKAPTVTRERLYLETIEEVMAGSNKVVVDVTKSNNLMYLPLDKIVSRTPNVVENDVTPGTTVTPSSRTGTAETRLRERLRSREVR